MFAWGCSILCILRSYGTLQYSIDNSNGRARNSQWGGEVVGDLGGGTPIRQRQLGALLKAVAKQSKRTK